MIIFGRVTFDPSEMVNNNSDDTIMRFIKEVDSVMQNNEFTHELAVYLIRELKKCLTDETEKEEFVRFFTNLVSK